jgi:hypothetical protein
MLYPMQVFYHHPPIILGHDPLTDPEDDGCGDGYVNVKVWAHRSCRLCMRSSLLAVPTLFRFYSLDGRERRDGRYGFAVHFEGMHASILRSAPTEPVAIVCFVTKSTLVLRNASIIGAAPPKSPPPPQTAWRLEFKPPLVRRMCLAKEGNPPSMPPGNHEVAYIMTSNSNSNASATRSSLAESNTGTM